jgi:hypothetical protein
MPFEPGHEHAVGRPKNAPNKKIEAIRTAFADLVVGNLDNMQEWLERAAATQPVKALQIMSDLAQYSLPKLKQVDATFDVGDSLINKITIEVNAKRTEDIKQQQYSRSNWEAKTRFVVNIGGSRSSTKTYSVLQLLIVKALESTEPLVISVVRKSFPAMRITVMRDFFDLLKANGFISSRKS